MGPATGDNRRTNVREYILTVREMFVVTDEQYSRGMRPVRYSINVTVDGCCDHRAIPADEDLHRHPVETLNRADVLLFGRVTYEMMESACRPPAPTGERPDWMEPFAQTISAAKKIECLAREIGSRRTMSPAAS